MTIHEQLAHAERCLQGLEGAVFGLRSWLGSDLDLVRLADDVARCREDVARLRVQAPSPPLGDAEREVIVVPDDEYDRRLWQGGDVDAEGLGVPGRRAP